MYDLVDLVGFICSFELCMSFELNYRIDNIYILQTLLELLFELFNFVRENEHCIDGWSRMMKRTEHCLAYHFINQTFVLQPYFIKDFLRHIASCMNDLPYLEFVHMNVKLNGLKMFLIHFINLFQYFTRIMGEICYVIFVCFGSKGFK